MFDSAFESILIGKLRSVLRRLAIFMTLLSGANGASSQFTHHRAGHTKAIDASWSSAEEGRDSDFLFARFTPNLRQMSEGEKDGYR